MDEWNKSSTWLQALIWGGIWAIIPHAFRPEGMEITFPVVRSMALFSSAAILVLLNTTILLPRWFFPKKFGAYFLFAAVTICLMVWVQDSLLNGPPFRPIREGMPPARPRNFHPFQSWGRMGIKMTPLLLTIAGNSLYEVSRYAQKQAKARVQLLNEKLEAELKFLKSQVNPHFLFNALNNIYALSVLKPTQAPDHLLKLSHLLRYMLYEANAPTVSLAQEIDYLTVFIELAQLKEQGKLNVTTSLDESRPHLRVAPLLFLPLIENAFKHSHIENLETGWIRIELKTGPDWVSLTVSNSVPPNSFTKDRQGGIGLQNIRRQLELIYSEKHLMEVNPQEKEFHATVQIVVS
ncbi:MAG: histidine kinase [Bacteroidota bacterium]